jgi:hypothetical protein
MPIKKRSAPQLRSRILETAWWGDDALDQDASDLNEWCRTADIECLKPKAGERLDVIKYRGLSSTEQAQVPNATEFDSGLFLAQCYQAVRYGLISITGFRLDRSRSRGLRGLTQASLDQLSDADFFEKIPLGLAIRELYGTEDDGAPIEDIPTSLAVWLGVHILRETFRPRDDNGDD